MLLLLTSLALATPDGSAYRATLTPLCTSDESVVFLLQESDHDGTYYGSRTVFRWGSYDVSAGRWRFLPLLDLHDFSGIQPAEDVPPLEKRAGKGTIGDLLGPRGTCAQAAPAESDPFTYGIGPKGISVSTDGASRTLAADVVWTVQSVGDEPERVTSLADRFETDCALWETRSYAAPRDRTLLVARGGGCDNDGHPLRIVVVSTPVLAQTRSVTLNQGGLDALRAGTITEAIARFSAALGHDRTNTTATYNLACAYARAGQARDAVGVLSRLPHAGLAAKLAADRDFDGVRSDPVFVEFVAGL